MKTLISGASCRNGSFIVLELTSQGYDLSLVTRNAGALAETIAAQLDAGEKEKEPSTNSISSVIPG